MQTGVAFGSIRHHACIEYICGCSAVRALVGFKDRSAGKTDVVGFPEMTIYITVHLSKLAAVTFVYDEYDFCITISVHQCLISLGLYRICHFLNRRDNELAVGVLQLLYKNMSAVGIIHTVFLERVIFINGLVVQILAVDQEDDLVYVRLVS